MGQLKSPSGFLLFKYSCTFALVFRLFVHGCVHTLKGNQVRMSILNFELFFQILSCTRNCMLISLFLLQSHCSLGSEKVKKQDASQETCHNTWSIKLSGIKVWVWVILYFFPQ